MFLATTAVILYLLLGAATAILVARARLRHRPRRTPVPLSIIVAARNEERTLPSCLDALAAQDYPPDLIEFLIVDDASEDATAAVIQDRAAKDARFRYVLAETHDDLPPGKPSALETGIDEARHDLLLFTDADCRPPSDWARAAAAAFDDEHLGILGGTTRVAGKGLLARLQALDWILLKGVLAGWSLAGKPLSAMGNNLSLRREAYDEVGGFASLRPSVTEDYILFQAIASSGRWKAEVDPHPDLENRTEAVDGLLEVFRQRRRWARGALAASPLAFGFYAVVYAAHVLPLLLVPTAGMAAISLVLVKVLADVLVVVGMSLRSDSRLQLALVPLYEIYLYMYVILLPLSLAVAPDIVWKSRRHVQSRSSSGSAR